MEVCGIYVRCGLIFAYRMDVEEGGSERSALRAGCRDIMYVKLQERIQGKEGEYLEAMRGYSAQNWKWVRANLRGPGSSLLGTVHRHMGTRKCLLQTAWSRNKKIGHLRGSWGQKKLLVCS